MHLCLCVRRTETSRKDTRIKIQTQIVSLGRTTFLDLHIAAWLFASRGNAPWDLIPPWLLGKRGMVLLCRPDYHSTVPRILMLTACLTRFIILYISLTVPISWYAYIRVKVRDRHIINIIRCNARRVVDDAYLFFTLIRPQVREWLSFSKLATA